MNCPKCQSPMESVSVEGTEVDRCTSCKGLWFDAVEHETALAKANAIDIGDEKLGAEFNSVDRINCPACPNSPMIRMVDIRQRHIWFESCPTCHGRFYDAGEFRDLAEYSFADVIKDIFAKERQ